MFESAIHSDVTSGKQSSRNSRSEDFNLIGSDARLSNGEKKMKQVTKCKKYSCNFSGNKF